MAVFTPVTPDQAADYLMRYPLGDLVALMGAAATARLLLGIDWATMFSSFADNLSPDDFFHGVGKSVAFGFVIALSSCHFGLAVRGGSPGVGRAEAGWPASVRSARSKPMMSWSIMAMAF